MAVCAYIDGFNLYYRALRSRPETKWLDVARLVEALVPHDDVLSVKLFTARVHPTEEDPGIHMRQHTWLRAVCHDDRVRVVEGQFKKRVVWRPLADNRDERVRVVNYEEKGSDVNLATHLVFDACHSKFDKAVVITNDTDIAEPVRLVRDELSKYVMVVNPNPSGSPAHKPKISATVVRRLRASALRACQLPDELRVRGGTVRRPERWRATP